jgi:tetratricopeptide (TPR) repeat protein
VDIYREVGDVVEAVRNAKARSKKCALLIGAGCSVKAGIPLASGFVRIIEEDWPRAYRRAEKKTYPHCMAELAVGERRDLIARYVDTAKINWAHLAIAQLIKTGHVDRVLTTNFDPLVLRACAMVGVFPAVYDFAASRRFKPAYVPEPAVFHLHGQHTGFVVLHTEEEVQDLSSALVPLFEDDGGGRLWLVVGYSGENDPVFEHLAKVARFDERLYWVGYKDSEPAPHVRNRLLGREREAYYVKGHDADDFFALLGQALGSFPPRFIQKPFSHLREMLGAVMPYTLPGQDSAIDVCATPKTLIDRAIADLEAGPVGKTLLAEMYLQQGQFDEVIGMKSADMPPNLAKAVAWAYTMQGNALYEQAKTKSGAEAEALYAQAGEKYAAALAIKPDHHEALNNWGAALYEQAKRKSGAEADDLLAQADEKVQAALGIKPDDHEALYNWGTALSAQAKTKSGAEAEALFAQAGEKYAAALGIKPDKHEALYNWGLCFIDWARARGLEGSAELLDSAWEKCSAAEALVPGLGAYSLACISSLRGDEEGCRRWLEVSRTHGELPSREHLLADLDLENVRAAPWFQGLAGGA